MTQVYSVPQRESELHSLPDVEVFEYSEDDIERDWYPDFAGMRLGWYYWHCLPGCLPDGDPIGPFATEQEAVNDAQSEAGQFEDDDDTPQ